jgi:undecaprenyl-diphosphatase
MLFFLIAGLIQGLTEFLPVSSSAHLAFFEKIFSIEEEARLSYAVFLHFGTFLALLLFFARRIERKVRERDYSLLAKILFSSLPLLFALPLKNLSALSFTRMKLIGIFLILTGILILATRFPKARKEEINYSAALLCGIFQLLAIFPGISRSGVTIAILLLLGIKEEVAFEFSFLLAIPAVGMANLSEAFPAFSHQGISFSLPLLFGIFLSFLSGLLALFFLRKVMRMKKFYLFAFYLFLFGLLLLWLR